MRPDGTVSACVVGEDLSSSVAERNDLRRRLTGSPLMSASGAFEPSHPFSVEYQKCTEHLRENIVVRPNLAQDPPNLDPALGS